MKNMARFVAIAVVCFAFSGMIAAIAADMIAPATRVSSYDWQCQDKEGRKISDHARFDTAFVACYNSSNGAFLQGGRYSMPTKAAPPPPPPSPPVSVALSWSASTKDTNGQTITVDRYEVSYGTSPTALSVTVSAGNVLQYTVTGLEAGRLYYFGVRAVKGAEKSELTNLVQAAAR